MTDNTAHDHVLRERRLRDRAARLGYVLRKARTRLQESPLWSMYMLVDRYSNTVAASGSAAGYGLNLDEIEELLTHEEKRS